MSKVVEACYRGKFPDFETMCHYGISTVQHLDTYTRAVRSGRVNARQLERSMREDTLHVILGDDAIRSGWNKGIHECERCRYVGDSHDCANCLNKIYD